MSYAADWYAYVNGQVQGPFTPEQLAAMARGGAITPQTPLCGDGRTYLPASQALPQLFAAARGPAAPPMSAPMAPPMAPPMGPPMMPRPTGRRGAKVALFVGLVAVAGAVVLIILLSSGSGGGSALLASLTAELPAGDRFEFMDIDAMEALGEDAARGLDDAAGLPSALRDKSADLFPKGKRGVTAVVRTDDARVRIYCPRALEESALTKLLESTGYQRKSEDGVELWVSAADREVALTVKKGRIYSGPAGTVKDMVLGKLASEKTFARSEGCRELLASISSSPATVEMRKESRGTSARPDRPRPSWSARETSVAGSRIQARMLGLFANAEDVEKAFKELQADRPKIEEAMKQGRRLPFKNVEFQSLDWQRRGTLVIVTTTFRRTGGKPSAPDK